MEHPDRPSRVGVTEEMLDVLAGAQVRTTMFIQGRWAESYPQLTRRIAADGHLVGCHSFYHARLPLLSRRGLSSDVRSATTAIRDACGVDPRPWFRAPFGALDRGTAVLDQLTALGYRNVGWHVDSRDWASRGAKGVIRRIIDGVVEYGDGAIVLMHGWPAPNPVVLPRIIDELRARGAEFVTVDALDSIPPRAAWDATP